VSDAEPKVDVNVERLVIPYSDFYKAANVLLKISENDEIGAKKYCLLSSLTFRAFSLESFLNHIGALTIGYWSEVEKGLNPKTKIIMISEKLGVDVDWGKAPWQVVAKLTSFRNKVAHGKTELLEEARGVTELGGFEEVLHQWLLSEWEEAVLTEDHGQIAEHTYTIFEILHKASGDEEPLLSAGRQTGGASLIRA